MIQFSKTQLQIKKKFDPKTCRHYINGHMTVLHCHHYSTLYTQLAMDCSFLDAKKLLADSMEEAAYDMLTAYYDEYGIEDIDEKVIIAEQHYAVMGLGKLDMAYVGSVAGTVYLESSHLDAGWMKKWGKSDVPVNYIGAGFIAAAFAAIYDKPLKSFRVKEVESIACGAPKSIFKVVAE